jgi:hypothetical protein
MWRMPLTVAVFKIRRTVGPEAVPTLRRRPGAESTAPFDRATSYWSPFDSEHLCRTVSEISRSKHAPRTIERSRTTGPDRSLLGEPGIAGLRESDPFPRSSLARGAGIVAADLEIFYRKRSIFRRFFARNFFTQRVKTVIEVSLETPR